MLPGFRFLFAAIVLSMSVLVFGLGAAAVLRAAHEQFAESGSWRPAPDTAAAQQGEMPGPVLAMLRVDQPAVPKADAALVTPLAQPAEMAKEMDKSPEPVKTAPPEAQAASPQQAARADIPELAKLDAAKPEVAKPEVAKPEVAPEQPKAEDKETQPAVVAAVPPSPAQREAPAAQSAAAFEPPAASDTKTAAADPAPTTAPAPAISPPAPVDEPSAMPTSEAFPAAPEQPGAPTAANPARIATLGGPPVVIEVLAPDKAVRAGPDPSEVKKEKEKQRAEEQARRRRLAARQAKLAREAAQAQQAANPFAPPNQAFYIQPAQANASARTR
jgi:hypothetical protein